MIALMITSLAGELEASSWYNPTTWSMPSRESLYNIMPSSPQWVNSLRSGWSSLSPTTQTTLAGALSTLARIKHYSLNQWQKGASNEENIDSSNRENPNNTRQLLSNFNNRLREIKADYDKNFESIENIKRLENDYLDPINKAFNELKSKIPDSESKEIEEAQKSTTDKVSAILYNEVSRLASILLNVRKEADMNYAKELINKALQFGAANQDVFSRKSLFSDSLEALVSRLEKIHNRYNYRPDFESSDTTDSEKRPKTGIAFTLTTDDSEQALQQGVTNFFKNTTMESKKKSVRERLDPGKLQEITFHTFQRRLASIHKAFRPDEPDSQEETTKKIIELQQEAQESDDLSADDKKIIIDQGSHYISTLDFIKRVHDTKNLYEQNSENIENIKTLKGDYLNPINEAFNELRRKIPDSEFKQIKEAQATRAENLQFILNSEILRLIDLHYVGQLNSNYAQYLVDTAQDLVDTAKKFHEKYPNDRQTDYFNLENNAKSLNKILIENKKFQEEKNEEDLKMRRERFIMEKRMQNERNYFEKQIENAKKQKNEAINITNEIFALFNNGDRDLNTTISNIYDELLEIEDNKYLSKDTKEGLSREINARMKLLRYIQDIYFLLKNYQKSTINSPYFLQADIEITIPQKLQEALEKIRALPSRVNTELIRIAQEKAELLKYMLIDSILIKKYYDPPTENGYNLKQLDFAQRENLRNLINQFKIYLPTKNDTLLPDIFNHFNNNLTTFRSNLDDTKMKNVQLYNMPLDLKPFNIPLLSEESID